MHSMRFDVVLYGLWAVFPVVLAVLAIRPVSARELSRFSWRYSLEITPEAEPAIVRSVRRGRTARLTGATLGLSLYPVLDALHVGISSQSLFYGLAGYILGAFTTAVVPGLRGAGERRASLLPRFLSDYLPRAALITPLVAVGVSGVADLIYEIEPHRSFADWNGSLAGFPLAAIAVVFTFLAIKSVVARPQPLSTPGLLAVDDAVRTQAVHTLAGVGISLALFGAASCLLQMGGHASPNWLHIIGIISGLCALAGAVYALMFRGAPWRVQRSMLQ